MTRFSSVYFRFDYCRWSCLACLFFFFYGNVSMPWWDGRKAIRTNHTQTGGEFLHVIHFYSFQVHRRRGTEWDWRAGSESNTKASESGWERGAGFFFVCWFCTLFLLSTDWASLARPSQPKIHYKKYRFYFSCLYIFFTFIFRRPAQRKIVFLAFYLEVCKALTRDSKVKTLSPHKEMSFFSLPVNTTLCLRRRSSGLSPIPTKKETDTIEDDQHDDVFQHCGKVWKTFHEAATTSLPKRFN